jgi:Domain of unknown function (DUF4833)
VSKKTTMLLLLLGLIHPQTAAVASTASPPAACPAHLFVLERSTNANIVVYDAQRGASGELDASKPVVAYWILNAEKGQREELSSIQWNRAYGFDTRPAKKPGHYRMTFKANLGRSFVVEDVTGCPVAVTHINDHKAIVRRVFVQVKTTFLVPSVQAVTMYGDDLETGAAVQEIFHP